MSDTIPGGQSKPWKYDVDKGFAWIVLIGCFVMYMFVIGSFKAFGLLYTEMVEYYSAGSGNTAWISAISLTLLYCLGPIANLLCKLYSFRRVTMVGGILFGLGYFLSGFVTKMEYMYFTFFSTGLGYGLSFAPCSTIISYYFDKRRALANGIMVSGSGVGAIALPFLYKYLIEQYGLNGAFWIIGATFSNVCVAACVFRQPRYLVEEQKEKLRANKHTEDEYDVCASQLVDGKGDKNAVRNIYKGLCSALDLRFNLLKKTLFTLYLISFMCCGFAFVGSIILIPSSVKTLGYDKTYVALSVIIFGGVEVVARILIGWFADLHIIKCKYIYVVNMFIVGAFSLIAPLFESFSFIAVYATVAASFAGSYLSLRSVLIIEAVDLENFSSAFGLLSLTQAIGVLPGQPAMGWLYDLYGNWNPSFILTGFMYILAGIIVLLEPFVVRCWTKSDNEDLCSPDNQNQSHDQGKPTDGTCKDELQSSDTSFSS
ncbi:monocarboxylate transporter 12-like [Mercenaria mercenaria]|uniref:monocarboxylate transporter 12-like n=1 Tax=Mercenaria mercenaria TaxID=6596 RepID=UPI00234E451C|nr:monocarboxylate transporter 12-like [Mercenaria mercenaria]